MTTDVAPAADCRVLPLERALEDVRPRRSATGRGVPRAASAAERQVDAFVGRTVGPFGQNLCCPCCRATVLPVANVAAPARLGPACCPECGAMVEFKYDTEGCTARVTAGPAAKWTARSKAK